MTKYILVIFKVALLACFMLSFQPIKSLGKWLQSVFDKKHQGEEIVNLNELCCTISHYQD